MYLIVKIPATEVKDIATASLGSIFSIAMTIGKKKTPPPSPPTVEMIEAKQRIKIVISSIGVRGNKSLCVQIDERHS